MSDLTSKEIWQGKNLREGKPFIRNKTRVVDPIGIAPYSFDLEKGRPIAEPQFVDRREEIAVLDEPDEKDHSDDDSDAE